MEMIEDDSAMKVSPTIQFRLNPEKIECKDGEEDIIFTYDCSDYVVRWQVDGVRRAVEYDNDFVMNLLNRGEWIEVK